MFGKCEEGTPSALSESQKRCEFTPQLVFPHAVRAASVPRLNANRRVTTPGSRRFERMLFEFSQSSIPLLDRLLYVNRVRSALCRCVCLGSPRCLLT